MSKQLPRGWNEVKLKDIGEILGGGTPSTANKEYWNGDILWLTPTEVTALKTKYLYDTERKITELGLKNSSAKMIKPNSLIICTRATIGDCCINKKEISTNQGFKSITPNNNYDVVFLYYLINYNRNLLIANSSGSTFLEISKSNLENLSFYFPPLDEQKRIADILSTFDDLIENLNKLIEKKEIYKKGVMQRVLTGKVRFEGFTDEWETVSISELVDKNIINIAKGKAISKDKIIEGDIPVIAGGKTPAYYHNEYTHDFPCITISASGTAGYVWFHDYKIWASDCNILYTDNKNYNVKFLYYYLLNIQKIIYGLKTGGVQPHVYAKDIITLTIPNISLEEQNKIAELLTLIDKDIDNLKQLLHLRKLQKKGVMQKLLTGEVRV